MPGPRGGQSSLAASAVHTTISSAGDNNNNTTNFNKKNKNASSNSSSSSTTEEEGVIIANNKKAAMRNAALAIAMRVSNIGAAPTATARVVSEASTETTTTKAQAAARATVLQAVAQASFAGNLLGQKPSSAATVITSDSTSIHGDDKAGKKRARNSSRGHLGVEGDGSQGLVGMLAPAAAAFSISSTMTSSTTSSIGRPELVRYASNVGIGAGVLKSTNSSHRFTQGTTDADEDNDDDDDGYALPGATTEQKENYTSTPATSSQKGKAAVGLMTAGPAVNKALARSVHIDAAPLKAAPLVDGNATKKSRTEASSLTAATAGSKWFHLPAPELTPELRRDLLILRNRAFLDPKRHYKTKEERRGLPKFFQIGTVVDSGSGRISSTPNTNAQFSKKQKKPTLVAALLADEAFTKYAKRTVENVHKKATGGGVGAYKARKGAGKGPGALTWYKKKAGGGGGKRR